MISSQNFLYLSTSVEEHSAGLLSLSVVVLQASLHFVDVSDKYDINFCIPSCVFVALNASAAWNCCN